MKQEQLKIKKPSSFGEWKKVADDSISFLKDMKTFCDNIQLLFEQNKESLGLSETGVIFCVSQAGEQAIHFQLGTKDGLDKCKEMIGEVK